MKQTGIKPTTLNQATINQTTMNKTAMNQITLKKTNLKTGYILVILAATLWGVLGVFVKKLNIYGFTTEQIVFIRAFGAFLTLAIFSLIKNVNFLRIKPRHIYYFLGTGIFSFLFFNWCYFTAIKLTSLSVAAILLYTAPSIVMILSAILFKEKITRCKLGALVLTFVGCFFVTAFVPGTGQGITLAGLLAGLGAGLGYALYSIFCRYALRNYSSVTVTLYTFLFAWMGVIPFIQIKDTILLLSNPSAIFHAAAMGLVSTALPFLLYTKGLSCLETSKASIIATLEPIVATLTGVLLFSELLTLWKIAGIALVILAVALINEKPKG